MNEENKNYYWLYVPTNMKFDSLKEAKKVLGTNRSRRLRHENKLILVPE